MTDFNFWSPTYFAFGRGAEARTGELVRRFGGKKALLHYGGRSAVASGLVARVKSSLPLAAYLTQNAWLDGTAQVDGEAARQRAGV